MRGRSVLAVVAAAVAAVAAAVGLVGCAGAIADDAASDSGPRVVVTTSILGSVVRDLVATAASVRILIPDGTDPHEWQASARDIEAVQQADLVVANGLGLEERLDGALAEAERRGVTVFRAGDHTTLRRVRHGERSDDGDGTVDPHLWMSPAAMRDVVVALGPVLAAHDIDVATSLPRVEQGLDAVDRDVRAVLASVPPDRRTLVTGHESMGYFADRYGFRLAGAVVPGLSSQADVSAGALAALKRTIERERVPVVFTELGTPHKVADAVAREAGARLVPLATHRLPADGSYRTFLLDVGRTIASALGPS